MIPHFVLNLTLNIITQNDLINKIEIIASKKFKIIQKSQQLGEMETTFADISHAKTVLNWKPQANIDDGLKIMYKWTLSNK